MTQDTVQAIEKNIQEAKEILELGNSLERLKLNRDFREVVLKGYFEKEAIRLVHLKADPLFQSPERQQSILAQIDAIGTLSGYFATVLQKADIARKAIEADEEERDAILAEEAGQ
jgi:CHAT domain-containing protein